MIKIFIYSIASMSFNKLEAAFPTTTGGGAA
jgi:hypothetical protein